MCVQAIQNSSLEDLFNRVSPGALYAKVTSSGKPVEEKAKAEETLDYYL
jgi:hypothetical protein